MPELPRAARDRFARLAAATTSRYEIRNADADPRRASVHLYGVIGDYWDGIDAQTLVPEIRALDVDTIDLYVNSPGGSVYDGIAIRNALRQHAARVVVTVDGLAASAASFIACAGDEVVMGENAEIMIHDAWGLAIGNAEDMSAAAEDLDRISDNIAAMYAAKAGGKPEDWRALMKAETWYSAAEAVAAGLADRLDSDKVAAASNVYDLSMYAHAGRAAAPAPIPAAAMAAPRKELQMDPEEIAALREGLSDVQRTIAMLPAQGAATAAVADDRSAGEWLRALAANDADTVREYEAMVEGAYSAEYTGGTSDDGILTPQWVGDTIRLIDAPNPLADIFSTGTLPSKGLQLEYGVLESDTVKVEEQVNEGDDLAKGSITLDVEHAPIKTYGGHVELSRQKIERTTNVNVLNLHLRALALRASQRKAAVLRAHYQGVVNANKTNRDRVIVVADQDDYLAWIGGIVDGAEKFLDLGLGLDAIVADKTVFKTLAGLHGTDGRPLMRVSGTGVNTVGDISPKALGGDLAGVTVRVNLKQATPGAAMVNGEAIRQYNGSITELADENIVNLSKRFGLYYYASLATEIPDAILPIVAQLPAAPAGS
jgi:ATP-dependent Clp endopeptidase proteolytic subunit ClpP